MCFLHLPIATFHKLCKLNMLEGTYSLCLTGPELHFISRNSLMIKKEVIQQ